MVSVVLTIISFLPVLIFSIYQPESSLKIFEHPKILKIDLVNTEDFKSVFYEILPNQFFLSTITMECDTRFSEQEFFYLTSLAPMRDITIEELAQSLVYLKCKNKFNFLRLSISQNDKGYAIKFFLEGQWIVNKIVFKGLLSESHAYRNYYLLEPGEPFSIAKHKHSLERIIDALNDTGYLKARVLDYFDYDKTNKAITINIVVDKGDQFTIDEVDISCRGQQTFDVDIVKRKVLKKFLSKLRYKTYSRELVDKEAKNIKQFLVKRGFVDAVIRLEKTSNDILSSISLKFSIELFNKKRFLFSGNRFFSKKELQDIIFQLGRSVGLLPERLLQDEIVESYAKKGFWHVHIEQIKNDSDCLFLIDEGLQAKIISVSFAGLEQMKVGPVEECFNILKMHVQFDEDLLKKALDDCTNCLLEHGFLHAKILTQEYIPLNDLEEYNVHITIEEGPQFYLKEIIIDGFPELLKESPFLFCSGVTVFNTFWLQAQKEWLTNYFQKKGCFFVHLVPQLSFENNQVTVTWKVERGDDALRFGKVIVQGNCNYPFTHILRELDFKEDMDWSKERLESSIIRLRKLGIFETIYLHPLHISSYEHKKIIVIKLKEDDPFEIRARFGFQQVSAPNLTLRKGTTYKFGGSFLYKNPFNEGGFFRFDTDLTRFYRNVSLLYKRPWIFSFPVATLYKLYSNKYIQPVYIGSDKPLYQALQQGFLIGFSRCWPIADMGFNVGFETMETNDLSVQLARAINFKPYFIDKKVPYFFLEPNIVLNYLDDQLNPTRGWFLIVSIKSMLTWQKRVSSFTKVLCEQSCYIPIRPVVVALRLRFGHIFNTEFNTIMPPERFYLGGAHSIRSYEPDFTPPLGCYIDEHGKEQLVPQGGRTMVNGNIEVRFPIWHKLGGVIFQDMGMLIEKSFTEVIKGNRFVAGTGFGIRYNTPVGPLSFDIGFKWKCLSNLEKRYAWFLSLGQAF